MGRWRTRRGRLGSTPANWGLRHPGRREWAVRGLDLTIEPGERVLLLGASGAGKSTLLTALAGLVDTSVVETEGELLVDGRDPREARDRTGLLFQDPESQIMMGRAGDDVAFGLENRCVPSDGIWPRVDAALAAVDFPYGRDRPTHALSGGEQQRLALAGTLALRPGLLMLDEPTANLDPDGAAEVRSVLGARAGAARRHPRPGRASRRRVAAARRPGGRHRGRWRRHRRWGPARRLPRPRRPPRGRGRLDPGSPAGRPAAPRPTARRDPRHRRARCVSVPRSDRRCGRKCRPGGAIGRGARDRRAERQRQVDARHAAGRPAAAALRIGGLGRGPRRRARDTSRSPAGRPAISLVASAPSSRTPSTSS